MKKIFILALVQITAPFTTLTMNPPLQEQNSQVPIIPYLENTDPKIGFNQYTGNHIYATVVPGAMPALNNNQTSNSYWTNNANQQIELVQFQTCQNQAHHNPIQYLLTAVPVDMQNQEHTSLETTNINQNQSKKRSANYPQQNKRHKASPQTNNPNINSQIYNPERQKLNPIIFHKDTYENLKNHTNNTTSLSSKLFKNLKSIDLTPTYLRLFFEKIYKNTFKNNKLFEIKDELLKKLISHNDIEITKQNIEELYWAIDCPIGNCRYRAHGSINNKKYPLCARLKIHIKAVHADNPNVQKTVDEIDQLKINLVLDRKKYQPIRLVERLEAHDNNITSIKIHLEQRYKNKFKNRQLCEINNKLLQKIISHDGIEQTKQNIDKLFWAIDCPINGCRHTAHTSINNKYLYSNLKKHIKVMHMDNPDVQKTTNKIDQQKINLVLKNPYTILTQDLEAHDNTNMPPLENNQPLESIDQEFAYDNDPQLVTQNFYFNDFYTIKLETFFENQNQKLTSNGLQNQIFDLFSTNQ